MPSDPNQDDGSVEGQVSGMKRAGPLWPAALFVGIAVYLGVGVFILLHVNIIDTPFGDYFFWPPGTTGLVIRCIVSAIALIVAAGAIGTAVAIIRQQTHGTR